MTSASEGMPVNTRPNKARYFPYLQEYKNIIQLSANTMHMSVYLVY